jgi:outer membrane protein assembly factor BamB
VYLGSRSGSVGELLAVDESDGDVLSTTALGGYPVGQPIIANGYVYTGVNNDGIAGVTASTQSVSAR